MTYRDDDDHRFGQLLASQARCEKSQAQTAQKLETMEQQLVELAEERTRGRTLLAAGRWAVGIACGSLISGAVWLWDEQRSHDVRITRNETRLESTAAELERTDRIVEQTQQDVAGTRGDVRAITSTLDEMRETLHSVDTQLRARRR